jgi:hypothetical protein
MSEFFERLQNQLRDTKEAVGVDLANNYGVSIHGLTYPAHNKILHLVGGPDKLIAGEPHKGGDFEFKMPFDNGTHAEFSGAVIGDWKENKEKGVSPQNTAFHLATARHQEPAIWLNRGTREYIHVPYNDSDSDGNKDHVIRWQNNIGTHGFSRSDRFDVTVEDIHSTLKNWSKKPYRGSFLIDTGDEVHTTNLSDEELQEHRKNASMSPEWNEGRGPVTPNLITVVPHFSKDIKTFHVYDTNTEQLHDTGIVTPWDKY